MARAWGAIVGAAALAACSGSQAVVTTTLADPAVVTTTAADLLTVTTTTAVPPVVTTTLADPPPNSTPPDTVTTSVPVPDLTGDLAWFAPLPPMPMVPGREFTGSDDFMDLFAPDAPWSKASGHLQVVKLYGEWVAYHATPAQLETAVQWIRSHGLALAVEAGPLDAPAECGQGIEGFAGTPEGTRIANRILAAGGRIDAVALDEPYYFASIYDGAGACRWDAAEVAAEVGEYVELMRSFFPDVIVGDTEPTPVPTNPATYTTWLETFREVNGYDVGFLHLDVDWGRNGWAADVAEIVQFGEDFGVPIGIIYTGNHSDSSDDRWLAIAGERAKEYEMAAGAPPPHVLFQSWMDHPDAALPETEPWTFTNMILTYFEDHEALGYTAGQLADDLSLGRPAAASATEPGRDAARAVDGDAGTHWSAGAFAPQWIEITLDGPSEVAEIRMTPSQFPAGDTVHQVLGWIDRAWVELAVIDEFTRDGEPVTVAGPWSGLQRVRVETESSPSWVAWFEIEVLAR